MTTTKLFRIILGILLLATLTIYAQPSRWKKNKYFTVMSYNVENLFDTIDTDKKDDAEYLPQSEKNWNSIKYHQKLDNLSSVISSVNAKELPEIVGLIEIENASVLVDLTHTIALQKGNYQIVHFEGPDPRGIDCGLLYRPDVFSLVQAYPIQVQLGEDGRSRTRDILYACGKVRKDTVHVFVNHWTSRRGGDETENKRNIIAKTLKLSVDSILAINPSAAIVILGDMNDEPSDSSLITYLDANQPNSSSVLVNLMYPDYLSEKGTYYYKGDYNLLDQIIISRTLTTKQKGFRPFEIKGYIFNPEFICYTQKNGDKAPSRTYGGAQYYGGFSDHFPVYATFYEK